MVLSRDLGGQLTALALSHVEYLSSTQQTAREAPTSAQAEHRHVYSLF